MHLSGDHSNAPVNMRHHTSPARILAVCPHSFFPIWIDYPDCPAYWSTWIVASYLCWRRPAWSIVGHSFIKWVSLIHLTLTMGATWTFVTRCVGLAIDLSCIDMICDLFAFSFRGVCISFEWFIFLVVSCHVVIYLFSIVFFFANRLHSFLGFSFKPGAGLVGQRGRLADFAYFSSIFEFSIFLNFLAYW
jgi:hypothetical protein